MSDIESLALNLDFRDQTYKESSRNVFCEILMVLEQKMNVYEKRKECHAISD